MKIALCGAAGLLGSTLGPFLSLHGHDVMTHSRGQGAQHRADLSDVTAAYELLNKISPDCIANLVGLTDVDRCEREPNQAYLTNVRTVENIASWIRQRQMPCHLIHISTDQVYDSTQIHNEDQVTLTGYYAISKYAGELAAASVPSTILRTNFVGRSRCAKRTSLTDWLFSSLSSKTPIQVFDDVLFSPLAISTLSEMIELSIRNKPIGVFNLGSHNGMSKADFAFAFADRLGLSNSAMTRTTTVNATQLKAYRPKDMRMDSAKFERTLGIKLPRLIDEIERVTEEYRENG